MAVVVEMEQSVVVLTAGTAVAEINVAVILHLLTAKQKSTVKIVGFVELVVVVADAVEEIVAEAVVQVETQFPGFL